jgi:hypothetical protein
MHIYINFIILDSFYFVAILEAVDQDLDGALNQHSIIDPFCGSGFVCFNFDTINH